MSKQLIVLVDRLSYVQLKGYLEKKIALKKLEEIVQQDRPWPRSFDTKKDLSEEGFFFFFFNKLC